MQTISEAVKAIDANAIVQADTKTKIVSVKSNASEIAIQEAITQAGYTVA